MRNRIKRAFNKLKHLCRIATRYDRRAAHFLAFRLPSLGLCSSLAALNVDSD